MISGTIEAETAGTIGSIKRIWRRRALPSPMW